MSHHHHQKIQMSCVSGLKHQNKITCGLFEGKSFPSCDYESAWSPTSPLDFRLFSTLASNPFGRSKSIRKKSWDSGKVGLSIVDDDDDHSSSTILLPSPDSKNIIFGSLMIKTVNPNRHKEVLDKPNVDLVELIDDTSCSVNTCCSGVENIGVSEEAGEMMKQPSSQGSLVEFSEDYTCVISHGPNPKTTHFYGDRVVESVKHNKNRLKKGCCGEKKESIFEIGPIEVTANTDDEFGYNDFLSLCCSCSKKLDMEKDIYMYRGYKAFCSSECRAKVIDLDEEMEDEEEAAKSGSVSDKEMSKKKSSNGVIFTVG